MVIIGLSLTIVILASTSLMISLLNDQIVFAPNFQAPPIFPQKPQPQDPGTGVEDTPTEGEMPIPNEGTNPRANEEIPTGDIDQYKVGVTFNSIRVHSDHDYGDAEYELVAYVYGQKVDLTKLSTWRGTGLTDISGGYTTQFPPGNLYTVNIDSFTPLTILTGGWEDDGCKSGTGLLPNSIRDKIGKIVSKETIGEIGRGAGAGIGASQGGPQGAGIGAEVGDAAAKAGVNILLGAENALSCAVNADEKLGNIGEAYEAPSFGVGTHSVKSSTGDYTLTYTIKAIKLKQSPTTGFEQPPTTGLDK